MEHAPAGRRRRRDALENGERLMAAAIRAGLAEGRNVPLARIAADAGVGVGTLYRHYPDRSALIEALEARAYRLLIAEADDALTAASTGLDAVERFLVGSFEFRDELVLPLHGAPWTEGSESARLRGEMARAMGAIVERGHADGSLRADVGGRTIVRFGAMIAHPLSSVPDWPRAAAELRAVFLRGIAGPAAGDAPGDS